MSAAGCQQAEGHIFLLITRHIYGFQPLKLEDIANAAKNRETEERNNAKLRSENEGLGTRQQASELYGGAYIT